MCSEIFFLPAYCHAWLEAFIMCDNLLEFLHFFLIWSFPFHCSPSNSIISFRLLTLFCFLLKMLCQSQRQMRASVCSMTPKVASGFTPLEMTRPRFVIHLAMWFCCFYLWYFLFFWTMHWFDRSMSCVCVISYLWMESVQLLISFVA